MTKIFTFSYLFLICLSSQASTISISASASEPQLIYKNLDLEVQLPQKAFDALKKWNTNFKIFSLKDYAEPIKELFEMDKKHEFPMAFISDLNGDKKADLVLLGEVKQTQYAVALVQKNNDWIAVEVYKWSIFEVRDSDIPKFSSNKKTLLKSIPFYILEPDEDTLSRMNGKKGIQIEEYLGQPVVYTINGEKAQIFNFKL